MAYEGVLRLGCWSYKLEAQKFLKIGHGNSLSNKACCWSSGCRRWRRSKIERRAGSDTRIRTHDCQCRLRFLSVLNDCLDCWEEEALIATSEMLCLVVEPKKDGGGAQWQAEGTDCRCGRQQ
jgi:hypothetical protein